MVAALAPCVGAFISTLDRQEERLASVLTSNGLGATLGTGLGMLIGSRGIVILYFLHPHLGHS